MRPDPGSWLPTGMKPPARADRLPDLTLTGTFLFKDTGLDRLLHNWILSLGAGLGATIFDGGKKVAAVDKAAAVVKERLAAYERTVATAIIEVENSLAAERHQDRYVTLLAAELDTARQALEEARRRYIKGLDPFYSLFDRTGQCTETGKQPH